MIKKILNFLDFLIFALVGALLVVCCSPTQAKCIANDRWRGHDKQLHAGFGAAAGTVGTLYFNDPWKGALTGVAVGAAKEMIDLSGAGTCSFQDFAVTAAGSFVGAYALGRWGVNIRANEARITYRLTMNLDRLGE